MADGMNCAIREEVEKQAQEQRRSLMYLVADFLRQQGLFKTSDTFTEEAQLSSDYQLCNNINLQLILTEYTEHYHSRFQTWPQICKQVENPSPKDSSTFTKEGCKEDSPNPKPQDSDKLEQSLPAYLGLTVTSLSQRNAVSQIRDLAAIRTAMYNRYPIKSELNPIASVIIRENLMTILNVHWDDVHGLTDCKLLLKESAEYSMNYQEFWNSVFTPLNGILLYGPPGAGKTMLAEALATEYNLPLFNITASSTINKWRDDPEKYIRLLFELATNHKPCIIFIDEIDCIAAGVETCGSDKSESARFRSELLAGLDRFTSGNNWRVILLAATNAPWNLDSALLRHLESHIRVDLPDNIVREEILKGYTEEALHDSDELRRVVYQTDGFSVADLKRLCKDAWMWQMQPIWSKLKIAKSNGKFGLLSKPKLIDDCKILLRCTHRILSTAKPLKRRYKEWKLEM